MGNQNKNIFIQKDFPHIDLEDAVVIPVSKKLWPLCDLKNLGNCQGVVIVPPKVHNDGNLYYWEVSPRIKSCERCDFHKKNCERC